MRCLSRSVVVASTTGWPLRWRLSRLGSAQALTRPRARRATAAPRAGAAKAPSRRARLHPHRRHLPGRHSSAAPRAPPSAARTPQTSHLRPLSRKCAVCFRSSSSHGFFRRHLIEVTPYPPIPAPAGPRSTSLRSAANSSAHGVGASSVARSRQGIGGAGWAGKDGHRITAGKRPRCTTFQTPYPHKIPA